MKLKRKDFSDLDESFISALRTLGDIASLKEVVDRLIIDFDVKSNIQSDFRVLVGKVKDELIEQSIIECSKNEILTLVRRKKNNLHSCSVYIRTKKETIKVICCSF